MDFSTIKPCPASQEPKDGGYEVDLDDMDIEEAPGERFCSNRVFEEFRRRSNYG